MKTLSTNEGIATPAVFNFRNNPRVCCAHCGEPIPSQEIAGGDKKTLWCWKCVRELDHRKLEEPLHG